MVPQGRGKVLDMLVGDGFTLGSQVLNNVPEMNGVPSDNSCRDEGEATGAVTLVFGKRQISERALKKGECMGYGNVPS
jgi:hypothetical protein